MDECAWCSDYRYQHHETGCMICGRFPWERGAYRCTGFVEKADIESRERQLLDTLEVK